MGSPLRVLAITRIFPNAVEPLAAAFNRQQFAALGQLCDLRVMATIPWFPASGLVKSSKTSSLREVPARDVIAGLDVRHPRVVYVPGLAGLSGALEVASLLPSFMAEVKRGVDVVLGSWAYPEGAASIALARLARVPAVVKAHGSDLNVQGDMLGPRTNLAFALPRAHRVVPVSKALGEQAVRLGARPESVEVVANGTDAKLFLLRDRDEVRRALTWPGGWPERLVLYVGRIERAKGVLDLLAAFATIADRDRGLSLALLGDGGAMAEARAAAAPLGDRVRFLGARPLAEVTQWMSASTLVTLPSHAEGSPNVVREALACGRPVVGTNVGGIPELVTPANGALVPAKDPRALGEALLAVASRTFDPAEIRASSGGSWEESAAALLRVLTSAVDEHRRAAAANSR
ncbi:MAG: glycosyltransferase [Labilithrix sp.]|nr:glycosyltransferase [Labilithrix sp.]MCW5811256.1 glycosyltransferase [Labilithrix sp.]